MNEERARAVLGAMIRSDGKLDETFNLVDRTPAGVPVILLTGFYTAEQLAAISWWMDNKP